MGQTGGFKQSATLTGNRNSTGQHKSPSNQYVNLSQSQRLNMSNFNTMIKNPAHSPTNFVNQSLKEYQEIAKIHGAELRGGTQQPLGQSQVMNAPTLTIQTQHISGSK